MKFFLEDPLISDQRVAAIEGKMRMLYPVPPETVFFTAYQPEDADGHDDLPAMAVFGLKTPDPKGRPVDVIDIGGAPYAIWKKEEQSYQTFVGLPDPALAPFKSVTISHLRKLRNIRTKIN